MNVYISMYALLLVIICMVIMFFIIQLGSSKIKTTAKKYFMYNATSATIWCLFYSITISIDDLSVIKVFYTLEYIGTTTVTVFYFLFALAYTKQISIKEKPWLKAVFICPLIFFLSLITNDFNGGLFYSEIIPFSQGPEFGYSIKYGPIFYLHYLYIFIMVFLTVYVVLQAYVRAPKTESTYKKQLLIILIVILLPIVISITRILNLISIAILYDLTPGSIGISYIFLYFALYRYKFLDVNPIAQKYIFDGINDGIILLDTNFRILNINKAAIDTLDVKKEDLPTIFKTPFIDLIKKYQSPQNYIKDLENLTDDLEELKSGSIITYDNNIEVQTAGDKQGTHYYNLIITPLIQKQKIVGSIVILRDVSDSVRAELYLNKKNDLQQLIIRLLSHDLANHVQVLNFYSDILENIRDEQKLKETNQNFKIKIQAINTFIKDVLYFLREEEKIYSQTLEVYDLIKIIEQLLREFEPELKQKNISKIFNKPDQSVFIHANITFKSAIFNILSNAIKFSPSEGEISINVDVIIPNVILKIADHGNGIPDELKEKVFEPFISYGERKGTGLGLTIVREAVQNLNGKVWIEDNKPSGTIICLELPCFMK